MAALERIEFSRRAERDLRRLPKRDRVRIWGALERLEADEENIDVKALAGRSPWRRMRVGERRVIFRPIEDVKARWLIARIIDRRDLDRAVRSLGD
jgi:mRNA-degrading endonuclease RelE of RelBE toxin-antitoxin system